MSELLNLIEGIFSNSRQIQEMLYPEYFSIIRQKLPSGIIWIAFWNVLSRSVFVRTGFFSLLLLFTSCSHIIFGSNLDSIDTLLFQINSIFYDLVE